MVDLRRRIHRTEYRGWDSDTQKSSVGTNNRDYSNVFQTNKGDGEDVQFDESRSEGNIHTDDDSGLQSDYDRFRISQERYSNNRRHEFNRKGIYNSRSTYSRYRWWQTRYNTHLLKIYNIIIHELYNNKIPGDKIINFDDFCQVAFNSSSQEISDYI